MGLVRDNIPNDLHGLTQWVYRKLKNHHPMAAREQARAEEQGGRTYAKARRKEMFRGRKRQFVTADKQSVGYILDSGECFLIKVEQIEPEQLMALGVGNLGE